MKTARLLRKRAQGSILKSISELQNITLRSEQVKTIQFGNNNIIGGKELFLPPMFLKWQNGFMPSEKILKEFSPVLFSAFQQVIASYGVSNLSLQKNETISSVICISG